MKKIVGNLYWTGRGIGYQVSSVRKARRLNITLIGVLVLGILGILIVSTM
jgi:ABC-type nitrate/sulfonate/bicarbonate transport system permease component